MEKNEAECEYWSFESAKSTRYAEVYTAVDSAGKPLYVHRPVNLADDFTCECTDGRTILSDMINCVSGMVLLSDKAADVFRRFRLGDTTFVPVAIVAAESRHPLGKAAVLVGQVIDFVDLQRSSFVPLSKNHPPIPWYFTAPPVVVREKLAGLDFAFGFNVQQACSNELRRAILREQLTNFAFEPLDVR